MVLLWKITRLITTILLIVVAQIFVANFLPFPFNYINISFSILLLFLTLGSNKRVIWLGLIVSYILELFSGSPFGIGMAATIISLLTIDWFQLNILTNRSGYMVFLSLLLGITLYRTLFVVILTINNYFFYREVLSYKEIVVDAGWEILLSSVLLFLLHLIVSKILKFLNFGRIKGGPDFNGRYPA